MTDRFPICLPFVLAQECPYPNDWGNPRNFSNDKGDPGGKTFCGIIQREYDMYRKHNGLPTRDVRELTEDEGHTIYETSYWLPHCPNLPPGLDLALFDSNVNMGSTEGTKILQAALRCANDGEWGPATQAAVDAITDVTSVIKRFGDRREVVYRMIPGFRSFGKDWLRRNQEITNQALKMAGAA